MIDELAYRNDGDEYADQGGTPTRPGRDRRAAAARRTAATTPARPPAAPPGVGVQGVNDAPTLSVSAANPTFTEDGAAANPFSGASVATVEAGQSITGFTFTVANLADGGDEVAVVDGTDIALTNGADRHAPQRADLQRLRGRPAAPRRSRSRAASPERRGAGP
ncbi:MAG: hypothetical protein U5L06_07000 [Rhodovibrio sp.]|nr:hypothetical protein [Rhodovibrio sp.]